MTLAKISRPLSECAGYPDVDLAFAAGLLEGEGSVHINTPTKRNHGALIVCVTNTNLELIDWLNARWPGAVGTASTSRPDQRPAERWTTPCRRALAFLEQVEPFVVTWRMRERIAAARWWQLIKTKHWRYRTEEDDEEAFNCFMWMKHLNRRGPMGLVSERGVCHER